jgi:adenylosuccinate lyase
LLEWLMRSNLQTALENVALWHERDISHSSNERIILPDTTTLASYATRRLKNVLEGLVVFPERMWANLEGQGGLVFSQRVLHQLIDTGLAREAAYEVVQRNALEAWESGVDFRELLARDDANPLSNAQLNEAFDLKWYLREVDSVYARFGL